jgi:hypothetical protein
MPTSGTDGARTHRLRAGFRYFFTKSNRLGRSSRNQLDACTGRRLLQRMSGLPLLFLERLQNPRLSIEIFYGVLGGRRSEWHHSRISTPSASRRMKGLKLHWFVVVQVDALKAALAVKCNCYEILVSGNARQVRSPDSCLLSSQGTLLD